MQACLVGLPAWPLSGLLGSAGLPLLVQSIVCEGCPCAALLGWLACLATLWAGWAAWAQPAWLGCMCLLVPYLLIDMHTYS